MRLFTAIALAASLAFPPLASGASLKVAPVIIDLTAPTATSFIRLWNGSSKPINVQVRVFRWSQANGMDVLEPAEGVMVSPPITSLKASGENLVRIVRTTGEPVGTEEAYRLVVDELPTAKRQAATVVMVVRHSIPVFFSSAGASDAKVEWAVAPASGGYQVTAVNRGDRRMKVFGLTVKSGSSTIARHDGLAGYVLGKSSISWFVPGRKAGGGMITVSGNNEAGSFNAKAKFK